MSSGYLRPIASAQNAPQQRFSPLESKPNRTSIPVACCNCRLKKAKCDGSRPSCTRCNGLQLSCQYDVTQGVSRAERFRLRKQRQTSITHNLTLLVDALRSGSDLEATTVLARLRLGESVDEIVRSLQSNPPSLSETVQTSAAKSKVTFNTAHAADASKLASIAAEPPTTSVHLDAMSTPGAVPISITTGQFLCTIFEREKLRLPADSPKEENSVHEKYTASTVLSRTQHTSSMAQMYSIDNCRCPFHGIRDFSTSVTLTTKAVPFSGEVARRFHGSWATYPVPQNNPTTVPYRPFDKAIGPHNKIVEASLRELSVPLWAMLCLNTKSGPGSINCVFSRFQDAMSDLIQKGSRHGEVFGSIPNIAALYDEEEYKNSCLLSQWAAIVAHRVQVKGHDFTCFASMYVFWYLMRWMISLSQETYDAIPKWLRPVPTQLFVPHIPVLDFVIWPKLREFAVSTPLMQEKLDWLIDLSTHIQCQWPFTLEKATCKDKETGHTSLTDQAQECIATLSNWSLAPSFRAYVPNADLYVLIRSVNG
ncbi:bZIP transcription factor [Stagonosporopsis vannaccii]|nr:bZIP transcription factor [Stagonosporopsis vannaccii]